MSIIKVNGANIDYKISGNGPQAVIFSHGFLFDKHMYDHQIAALQKRYTCVAYDHRGQGRSECTPSGYDIDNVTEDARALIEALNLAPCHFVGLSMGGFVGMRLAVRYPQLVNSLVLLETSAASEPSSKIRQYKSLGFVGRWLGFRLVIGRVLPIMFGQTFLNDPAREVEKDRWRDFMVAFDKPTLPKVLDGVTGRENFEPFLGQIQMPTLIINGDQDVVYPPAVGEAMQKKIPNSEFVIIPGAGHSSPIEEPAAVTTVITSFLERQEQ